MAKRKSPADIDRIVKLRLEGVPVRQVAEIVGCSPATVQKHYNDAVEAANDARPGELRLKRARLEARHYATANAARDAYQAVDPEAGTLPDPTVRARFMAAETQALQAVARVAGLDKLGVELSGPGGGPVQVDAAQVLAERLARLAPTNDDEDGDGDEVRA